MDKAETVRLPDARANAPSTARCQKAVCRTCVGSKHSLLHRLFLRLERKAFVLRRLQAVLAASLVISYCQINLAHQICDLMLAYIHRLKQRTCPHIGGFTFLSRNFWLEQNNISLPSYLTLTTHW